MMRQDIQFLRGFAVLAVVLYHAKILSIPGGFLGVDIFFVISGFLITSIIFRDLDLGKFSFKEFYIRRAKRLLPATYCTLIFTSLIGYMLLTKNQWNDYILQLLGTVTFSANIFLPFQTGYFENSADSKPLLHTWSLSLEEQYYLLIPLFLFILTPKLRGWLLAAGSIISLTLCFYLVSFPFTYWRLPTIDSNTIAFYTLPARAWELLAGSFLAWLIHHLPLLKIHPFIKFTALIALVVSILFPIDNLHPRGDAFIVVIATAVLLIGRDDWLPLNWVTRTIVKIGDWSYSLYLVHWPLFAFAHIAYLGTVPTHVKLLLVPTSLFLSYCQFQFVEQRFRFGWQANSKRTFQCLAGASLMVFLIPAPAIIARHLERQSNLVDLQDPLRRITGLDAVCSQGRAFLVPATCMTSAKPTVAVWGDSFAMHLMPGLMTDPRIKHSLVQITKSACAPIRGVASIDANYNESWAKDCLDFNENALKYFQNSKSIEYVILSSPFSGYFDYGKLKMFYNGRAINGERDISISQMVETIDALRRSGKHPIIITPPPMAGFDIGECWERKKEGLVVMNRSDCNFRVENYRSLRRGIIDALEEIERRTHVDMAWTDNIICGENTCNTLINNLSIYRDGGHLTVAGSEFLIPQLNLIERFFDHSHTTQPTKIQ
jgi:peptidoglycan/LPS O-acetylase OafA/YrhL